MLRSKILSGGLRTAKVLSISVLIAVLLSAATAAGAVEYEAVILHPSGFRVLTAEGISGGQRVGHGWGSPPGKAPAYGRGTAGGMSYSPALRPDSPVAWAGTGDTGKNQWMGNVDFMFTCCSLWQYH